MHEIGVTMLGSRGVGKTSLLTAMSAEFNNAIGTEIQLVPDIESLGILDDNLNQLKGLLKGDYQFRGGGIRATTEVREYLFGIGRTGKKPSLQIRFVDYPGEYISGGATPEQTKRVIEFLSNSAAVLVAIDAPALMEENGKWHDTINQPTKITRIFRHAYQELEGPRLVLLVPIRGEKYLKKKQSAEKLQKKVKDKYEELLRFFRSEHMERNIAVVITPVQTLGNAIFSHIKIRHHQPEFFFRKHGGFRVIYDPQDCDQPLRYLLRFLLKLHHDHREWPLFNFLRQWLGLDDHLKRAVSNFAADCKTSGGFEVIQGTQWLTISR